MNVPPNYCPAERSRSTTVDDIIKKIKSQGIFDKVRKECLADVDTKPAYRNLQQRVENYVTRFLSKQIWTSKVNKNQMRDSLRKHVNQSALLISGVERIVEQALNPKIFTTIKPRIDEVVCDHLGIDVRERQLQEKREKQRLLHAHHLPPQQLMSIDPTFVPAPLNSPSVDGGGTSSTYNVQWQPPFYQVGGGAEYMQYGLSQQYMHRWGSHHSVAPVAPGTEDTFIPRASLLNESTEPEDMDICDDQPEPPPLPPEPEPPPDDEDTSEKPAPPPEPPSEEATPLISEGSSPPRPDDVNIPLGGTEVEESQVTEEIVEMEIPCDDNHFLQGIPLPETEGEVKQEDEGESKYHFDWSNDIAVDISDIDSISSIHTSDLSEFSDEISDSELRDLDIKGEVITEGQEDRGEDDDGDSDGGSPTVKDMTCDVVCEEVVSPSKSHRVVCLSYNYSDSDDEETREDRRIRIAREKEERYKKRQHRRADLEHKKREKEEEKARARELKKSVTLNEASPPDTKTTLIDEITTESPSKSSPDKRRRTKAELKEALREQKVHEKRQALRRKRTRNKRYTSDEFTSIFTDAKRPFASRSYDTIVEEYVTETLVVCDGDVVEAAIDSTPETSDYIAAADTNDPAPVEQRGVVDPVKESQIAFSSDLTDDQVVSDSAQLSSSDESSHKHTEAADTENSLVSTSIHGVRAGSPFSDVSDESRGESVPDEKAEAARRGGSSADESQREKKTRSQRYSKDDLYKPRTSHRRRVSPAYQLDSLSPRRGQKRSLVTSDHEEGDVTEAGVEHEVADAVSSEGSKRDPAELEGGELEEGEEEVKDRLGEEAGPSKDADGSRSETRSRSNSASNSLSRSRSRSVSHGSPTKRHKHKRSHHRRKHRHHRRPSVSRVNFGMAAQQARIRDRIYNPEPEYPEMNRSPTRWVEPEYHSDRSHSPTPSNSSMESVLVAARRTDYHRRMSKLEPLSDDDQRLRPISPSDEDGSLKPVSPASRSMSPPELRPPSPSDQQTVSPYLEPVSREQSDADSDAPSLRALHHDDRRSPMGDCSPLERRRRHYPRHSPPELSSPRRHAVRHSRRACSPPHRYTPSPPHARRMPPMLTPPMMRPHGLPPLHPHFSPHMDPLYPQPYDLGMHPAHMPVPPNPYPYGVSRGPEGPLPKRPRH